MTGESSETTTERGIEVRAVERRFGKKLVLQDIDLDIRPAEVFGLLGPSGSGKTTLVKLIAGIDEATHGMVTVEGVRMPRRDMLGRIGYMAQSDALYEELTAKENLTFFASLFGLKGKHRARRIEEVMELVNLTDSLRKLVSAYSGGMKRRLSLAVALLHRPGVLILDEPTVGIDPVLRMAIWKELRAMKDEGTTIVVTTHVMDEAEKCDRLGMIRDGRLIAVGTPDELKAHTQATNLEAAFLAYGGVRA
ncbi:ABC transporter ATP-binding protein [Alicyclobacillus sp. ALC3]|uniref:ABC transporter ATP-binding protein n=1 Tax=Alicyclobacillus sp. ALC3 TaxID=2796143 RepID=UPI002377EC40|nr:ABC transporter ATP-binding protein [Alicyclobacillus sp. ALC3]